MITKYADLEVLEIKRTPTRLNKGAQGERLASFDHLPQETYRTDDGYLYVKVRAISSKVNKNHDGWPASELAGMNHDKFAALVSDLDAEDKQKSSSSVEDHIETIERVKSFKDGDRVVLMGLPGMDKLPQGNRQGVVVGRFPMTVQVRWDDGHTDVYGPRALQKLDSSPDDLGSWDFPTVSKISRTFTARKLSTRGDYGFKTFVGRPIFVDHNNSDPSRTRGVIVDSLLHIEPHRIGKVASEDYWIDAPDNHKPETWIELLLEVDAKAFPRLSKAFDDGDIDSVSMGCNVEHTTCSVCGNEAEDTEGYCNHIRNKGSVFFSQKHGKRMKAYEDCYGINFFEISAVFDPADDTALFTGKPISKKAAPNVQDTLLIYDDIANQLYAVQTSLQINNIPIARDELYKAFMIANTLWTSNKDREPILELLSRVKGDLSNPDEVSVMNAHVTIKQLLNKLTFQSESQKDDVYHNQNRQRDIKRKWDVKPAAPGKRLEWTSAVDDPFRDPEDEEYIPNSNSCPNCHSDDWDFHENDTAECRDCGYRWVPEDVDDDQEQLLPYDQAFLDQHGIKWTKVANDKYHDAIVQGYKETALWAGQDWSNVDDEKSMELADESDYERTNRQLREEKRQKMMQQYEPEFKTHEPEVIGDEDLIDYTNPVPLDENYSVEDISPQAHDEIHQDVKHFLDSVDSINPGANPLYGVDPEQVGHDLYLSRNGHGAGFFDGDYIYGGELQELATKMGERALEPGDDGMLYHDQPSILGYKSSMRWSVHKKSIQYLHATYAEMVAAFGKPSNRRSDGWKTDVDWNVTLSDGTKAEIYNWKNGKNYDPKRGLDLEDITEWNVQPDDAIPELQDMLGQDRDTASVKNALDSLKRLRQGAAESGYPVFMLGVMKDYIDQAIKISSPQARERLEQAKAYLSEIEGMNSMPSVVTGISIEQLEEMAARNTSWDIDKALELTDMAIEELESITAAGLEMNPEISGSDRAMFPGIKWTKVAWFGRENKPVSFRLIDDPNSKRKYKDVEITFKDGHTEIVDELTAMVKYDWSPIEVHQAYQDLIRERHRSPEVTDEDKDMFPGIKWTKVASDQIQPAYYSLVFKLPEFDPHWESAALYGPKYDLLKSYGLDGGGSDGDTRDIFFVCKTHPEAEKAVETLTPELDDRFPMGQWTYTIDYQAAFNYLTDEEVDDEGRPLDYPTDEDKKLFPGIKWTKTASILTATQSVAEEFAQEYRAAGFDAIDSDFVEYIANEVYVCSVQNKIVPLDDEDAANMARIAFKIYIQDEGLSVKEVYDAMMRVYEYDDELESQLGGGITDDDIYKGLNLESKWSFNHQILIEGRSSSTAQDWHPVQWTEDHAYARQTVEALNAKAGYERYRMGFNTGEKYAAWKMSDYSRTSNKMPPAKYILDLHKIPEPELTEEDIAYLQSLRRRHVEQTPMPKRELRWQPLLPGK